MHKNWQESGDKRKAFVPGTINMHLKKIEKLSFEKKQAIYLHFVGCMDFFSHAFPMVFSRAKGESGSNKTFLDVILNISGGKFGNFDQTKDQNAFLVLKELNNILTEQSKPKK